MNLLLALLIADQKSREVFILSSGLIKDLQSAHPWSRLALDSRAPSTQRQFKNSSECSSNCARENSDCEYACPCGSGCPNGCSVMSCKYLNRIFETT